MFERLKKRLLINLICILLIIFVCSFITYDAVEITSEENVTLTEIKFEQKSKPALIKPIDFVQPDVIKKPIETQSFWYGELTQDDEYLLAKIAMAEAEGESLECKIHIILVVLNRVQDAYFPDTIEEVIFQNYKGVYQFTPISDGRWYRVEPNEECWKALRIVKESQNNISDGALYFESCKNKDNWHSRNLQFLYEIDGTRFYK